MLVSNQRIRYKNLGSTLESVRLFRTETDKTAKVVLNPDTNTFTIVDAVEGSTLAESAKPSSSLHKVKIAAKEALLSLGVTFSDEKRIRSESSN